MRRVSLAIEAARYALENETDITVGQIELLERITENTSQNYDALAQDLRSAKSIADANAAAQRRLADSVTQLDDVEELVRHLERTAQEIAEWTAELDVKTRRLGQHS